MRNNRTFPGKIGVEDGKIKNIEETDKDYKTYLAPGFIDAHIHIESSMLCPSRFAEAVIPHGTTAVVADPHEIANVMGLAGIEYMIRDAGSVPLNVFFSAPSCVPATPFETAGAVLDAKDIEALLARPEVVALGEMMNFPGVVAEVPQVIAKLDAAKRAGKPIDGHAPMLSGSDLEKYVNAGISTDHECITLEEAREKAGLGMKIMLREGSASKNLQALAPLANEYDGCFLVSDDKHPEELREGHLNTTLVKAVALGIDPLNAVSMVTIKPAEHYKLNRGVLEAGMPADIVECDNLEDFKIHRVFIAGVLTAEQGKVTFTADPEVSANTINVPHKTANDFRIMIPCGSLPDTNECSSEVRVRVIEIVPDNIITKERIESITPVNGAAEVDVDRDILKLAVVNRYSSAEAAKGFIYGFGLKKGAVAVSVAHDSHNIIAVGANDSALAKAVNTVITNQGGFAVVDDANDEIRDLKLPVAGLMSTGRAEIVAEQLKNLQSKITELGSTLKSPFLTLSFMSLLVIPELKLSDKGLFDGRTFQFVDIVV